MACILNDSLVQADEGDDADPEQKTRRAQEKTQQVRARGRQGGR